jgi:hypothetical protein
VSCIPDQPKQSRCEPASAFSLRNRERIACGLQGRRRIPEKRLASPLGGTGGSSYFRQLLFLRDSHGARVKLPGRCQFPKGTLTLGFEEQHGVFTGFARRSVDFRSQRSFIVASECQIHTREMKNVGVEAHGIRLSDGGLGSIKSIQVEVREGKVLVWKSVFRIKFYRVQ